MIVFRYAVSDPAQVELRTQFHDDHKAHIRAAPFRVISSGPAFLPGSTQTAAALLIVEVDSISELEAFSANDPFVMKKVYSSVSIFEWRPSIDFSGTLS